MNTHRNARPSMDCEQALEVISASLDGEATLEDISFATDHLLSCEACRAVATAMENDDLDLRRLVPAPVSLANSSNRRQVSQIRYSQIRYWAVAAALCVAILGGILFQRSQPTTLLDPEDPSSLATARTVVVAPAEAQPSSIDESRNIDHLEIQRVETQLAELQARLADAGLSNRRNPFSDSAVNHANMNPFTRSRSPEHGTSVFQSSRLRDSPFRSIGPPRL